MTTDIKNLQILKAMYAAGDAIIEAGYFLLKEPLTAAQIDKEIGKDKLVTDGLSKYDQSNWLKAGSYEGFTLTDEGLTINITVGSFSCSMVHASIFRMIAKFEKLCGVPASKAKKFANKQEQERMVYAVKVTSFAAVTDNIAFADNTPASVEEHTNDTDTNDTDTNDTEKIYLPVVSAVSVPAVIAPAKEQKAEEHTDTMQPVIISLPVATVQPVDDLDVQPVEDLDAECVELVDDDINDNDTDTNTDTNTTSNDQEHTGHIVRRIFAIAASYVAIVVMMVSAFGGKDNASANNIHTTATLHTDTTETTTHRVYCSVPAVADTLASDTLASDTLASDTLVSDTLASDTLASDTLVSDSIEEHTDTINTDTINSTPASLDDASDDTDTNSPAALAIIPLVLPVIGSRKNHEKANENTNNNPSALADTKESKTMNATVTATKRMTSDMMQKFVNHIIEAKKTGEWDAPEKQYTGICGWAGVMSPDTRLA